MFTLDLVVETLPLAAAIGYNSQWTGQVQNVNICLILSKKILIIYCPMFYVPCPVCFLPMFFGPICFVCPMSCVSPHPTHSTSHALCAFFPCPLVPHVLCVPCLVSYHILCTLHSIPRVLSSHVLWSHMFCVSHVLCLAMSYALYIPCPVCFLPMSFGPICFVCPMSCVSPRPMHSTSTCPMCQIPAISVCEATCN